MNFIDSRVGEEEGRSRIVELQYDCTRMCTRRHDESTSFETLSLSLSRCLSWPRKGVAPASGFPPNLEGGKSGNRAPWYGMPEASSLLETSLYLPVGIVCQDALDQRPRFARQSHMIAKYRLNEIRGFRLFHPSDPIAF